MKTVMRYMKVYGVMSILLLCSCTSEDSPKLPTKALPAQPPQNTPASSAPPSSVPAVVPRPYIIIDAPATESVGLAVTFKWRLEGAKVGVSLFKLRLGKGENACDGTIDEEFDAGMKTCLTVNLSPDRYKNAPVNFAILTADSQGRQFCTRGGRLVIDPKIAISPGCDSGERKK